MTEEEKKAIEDLRRELTDEDRREYFSNWFAKDLDIILNLIQKQQEQLENKDRQIKQITQTNKSYKGMINKKDKIINKMANNILTFRADTILPTTIEGIKQYFEKEIEK